jgi:hypothetical protein
MALVIDEAFVRSLGIGAAIRGASDNVRSRPSRCSSSPGTTPLATVLGGALLADPRPNRIAPQRDQATLVAVQRALGTKEAVVRAIRRPVRRA